MRKTKSYPKVTRKRTAKERAERLNPLEENEEENEQEINREGKGFYACYLLTSLCPRFKGHTYIGFTVNPRRRIRQHNGEIRSGAFRTKKRRPWEMVFCIFGFPTNVSALQFEWAWQHPTESLAVRQAAATFKSFSGVANKIKLAYTMLNLPAWQSLNITVNYFSTKYTEHSAACPSLPEHMKVQVCPVDELPCYTETDESLLEFTDTECVFVDKEDSENTANICGNVEMNMTDIQAHSIGGFSSCYKGGGSSSSQDTIEAQQCNKGGNTSGTINETHADTILHIDENSDDEFWFKEYGRRQQTVKNISAENPPTAEVDHALVCSASSLCTAFSMEETNNGAALTSMNKSISDLDWLNGERLRDGTDKDRQAIHSFTSLQEIEVIDLLSPSPGSRIRSNIKKRRIFTGCPEIIDLT